MTSPFAVPAYSMEFTFHERKLPKEPPPQIAVDLVDLFGNGCRLANTIALCDQVTDTVGLVCYLLRALRNEYFAQLDSLSNGNPELELKLAKELIALFERNTITLVTALPVEGVYAAKTG